MAGPDVAHAEGYGRTNQKARTRKSLLQAAARLMQAGRAPSLEEVAEEALVSRATAYRYFPSIEALLVEASFDIVVPDAAALFGDDASIDPEERIDRAEAAIHRSVVDNEPAIRAMLASSITRANDGTNDVPVRQNRRTPLIEAALAPARARFDAENYARLCDALALVFGPEAMIVFRDVLQQDEAAARDTKSWAVRALVRAALADSRNGSGRAD